MGDESRKDQVSVFVQTVLPETMVEHINFGDTRKRLGQDLARKMQEQEWQALEIRDEETPLAINLHYQKNNPPPSLEITTLFLERIKKIITLLGYRQEKLSQLNIFLDSSKDAYQDAYAFYE